EIRADRARCWRGRDRQLLGLPNGTGRSARHSGDQRRRREEPSRHHRESELHDGRGVDGDLSAASRIWSEACVCRKLSGGFAQRLLASAFRFIARIQSRSAPNSNDKFQSNKRAKFSRKRRAWSSSMSLTKIVTRCRSRLRAKTIAKSAASDSIAHLKTDFRF